MNANDFFGKIYRVVENHDYEAIDGMTAKERDILEIVTSFDLYRMVRQSQKEETLREIEELEKELGVSVTEPTEGQKLLITEVK